MVKKTGHRYPKTSNTIFLEHFVVALQAVIAGHNIALLPEILIRKNISDGNIVQFSPEPLEIEDTFYLTQLPNAKNDKNIKRVKGWLKKISGND